MLITRAGFCLLLALVLQGCKLALVAVEGGDIESASGRFVCLAGNNCVIEVTRTNFNDVFIARPHEGYAFSHWLGGDSTFCGRTTNPRCSLDLRPVAAEPAVQAVLESDDTFYLIPVFVKLPAEEPAGLSARLQTRYDNHCASCHDSGRFGAPITHRESAWAVRLERGIDSMLSSVKVGRGAMPPNGRCGDCSDDDFRQLIRYMSGPSPR